MFCPVEPRRHSVFVGLRVGAHFGFRRRDVPDRFEHERSDHEGWPAARLPATLAEMEVAERAQRRVERRLAEARLPPDKTLDGAGNAPCQQRPGTRIATQARPNHHPD
jgi:hypothetical protein